MVPKSLAVAAVPPGFIRHETSGCIIPESDLDAHEHALAQRKARHSLAAPVLRDLEAAARTEVAAVQAVRHSLEAELAKVREMMARLGESTAPNQAAVAAVGRELAAVEASEG